MEKEYGTKKINGRKWRSVEAERSCMELGRGKRGDDEVSKETNASGVLRETV